MLMHTLTDLLKALFPQAAITDGDASLHVGSFAEWDSISHFGYLISVESHFGVQFSVEQMAELKSLADIARALGALGVTAA